MSDIELNSEYWTERYKTEKTGWDIGYANPALIEYAKTVLTPEHKILIPGAGNAYEAEALYKLGFTKVYATDLSSEPKRNLSTRYPDFPESQYLVGDFFELNQTFDVILEQTFFCALNPALRSNYVNQSHKLLNTLGLIAGVLFNFPLETGPPFGGSKEEYKQLFTKKFEILHLENSRNSIEPRKKNEFFFQLKKIN